MKRKVILFFVLVFWVLVVCTILAMSIERQMTVQVVVQEKKQGRLSDPESLAIPLEVLTVDDKGVHLYEVAEGSSWETGARVQETDPNLYIVEENHVVIPQGLWRKYILYTSKAIASGDLVQEVYPYKGKAENYLVIAAEETEQLEMEWEDVEILDKKENVLLLSMSGKLPYMESLTKNTLKLSKESRIYCLGEFIEFLKNIPLLAAMLTFLMLSVMFWGYSCKLSRNPRENRLLLASNVGIGLILLLGFARVARAVKLPSSLLPRGNILDLKYYKDEFTDILQTLKLLSNEITTEAIGTFYINIWLAGGVILLGIICGMTVLLLEHRIMKNSGKER